MSNGEAQIDGIVRAQAAAWLARLRSEERSPQDEAGFRTWLAESTRHRQAFDSINMAWEAVGALGPERQSAARHRGRGVDARRRALVTGGVGTVALAGGFGVWRSAFAGVYATGIGEQRRVSLADGTLVILDTNTRIRVALGDQRRRVDLVKGRAHFDVAKDLVRPFVVTAADQQLVAVGTAFDVMRDKGSVAVVVVEGQVAVRLAPGAAAARTTTLVTPGRRVVFDGAPVREDRPDLARVTAWQSGRAVFDNEPVASAVAEMNRYSRRPIVVADQVAARMHVSGVYSTGDTEAFARSLATLLPLDVSLEPDRVTLSAIDPAPSQESS